MDEQKLLSAIDGMIRTGLSEFRQEIKTDNEDFHQDIKAEMAGFKDEMKTEMAGFKDEMKTEMAGFKKEVKTELSRFRTELLGFRTEMTSFKKEIKIDMEGFKKDIRQEIKEELAEPRQILRALEHSAEVNKADHDAMQNDIAHIKGDLEGMKRRLLTVEAVAAENWKDITALKLAE